MQSFEDKWSNIALNPLLSPPGGLIYFKNIRSGGGAYLI